MSIRASLRDSNIEDQATRSGPYDPLNWRRRDSARFFDSFCFCLFSTTVVSHLLKGQKWSCASSSPSKAVNQTARLGRPLVETMMAPTRSSCSLRSCTGNSQVLLIVILRKKQVDQLPAHSRPLRFSLCPFRPRALVLCCRTRTRVVRNRFLCTTCQNVHRSCYTLSLVSNSLRLVLASDLVFAITALDQCARCALASNSMVPDCLNRALFPHLTQLGSTATPSTRLSNSLPCHIALAR